MIVLVTGGSGFLGRHLVQRLVDDGHHVRVLDVADTRSRDPRVEFVASSMTDESVLNAAVSGCEAVFHLASSVVPKTSNDNPILDARSNLIGTLQLMDASIDAGVSRFIFASSGGTVYGEPTVVKVKESHPTEPISSYGIVKLAVEKYLALYARLYGLNSIALRISNLYGEHQRHDTGLGVIASFCHGAVTDNPVKVWGDGSVSRDFIYVGDVVDAMVAALRYRGSHLVANIGSGETVSLSEILALIEELTGREVAKEYLPGRPFDVHRTCLDVTLADDALGWRPKTSLRDGISRVLQTVEQEERSS
ncbi:NAD-dependent epimerase/dehydratase family protein [Methyloligella sp. 2.7D]|uniref:NAD-dependent epimerase/dehydratase family protein n=1 Tax=unclassified Methyloligella TaxID=2625955 RepID=UPI00157D9403|nr:NAD-dependent epimerase/dehydratase family protein [Methyloligella sp. GL2]QKP77687.1 NAD-dependent epimerase/dehydratase family protein [Methyloligella sp. GL2]